MTKTIGIICEYNPFHNGHAEQFSRIRAEYPDASIVCIMSGNFTQRGEPAVLPAFDRAKMAVLGGADLVLEIPQPWSSGSAEYFAAGAVAVADRLGIIDLLAFGCEHPDPTAPMRTAERLDSTEFRELLAQSAIPGEGFAVQTQRVWRMLYGDDEGMLSSPNNLLAVQYCLALRRRGSSIRPMPMLRKGSAYDEETLSDPNPSATAVRRALREGADREALSAYLPATTLDILCEAAEKGHGPVFPESLEREILGFYRMSDENQIAHYASMRGGIAHRLCAASRMTTSLDAMLRRAATKAYTNSRLRRAVLHGMLGITEADLKGEPEGTVLLAATARGKALLRRLRDTTRIPIITRPGNLSMVVSQRATDISVNADALYTMAMPCARDVGYFIKFAPFFLE